VSSTELKYLIDENGTKYWLIADAELRELRTPQPSPMPVIPEVDSSRPLPDEIRRLMQEYGLNQRELCHFSGIIPATLSKILNNKSPGTQATVNAILFGVLRSRL
jgi:hypothetical protein